MKSFIQHNKFFIVLVTILIVTILGLGIYQIGQQKKPSTPAITTPMKPTEQEKPSKDTEITSFNGEYVRDETGNHIVVSWKYAEYDHKVTSISLKLNEGNFIDVSKNSYYEFSQSVYGFPTGYNIVTLRLTLQDGSHIEQQVKVYVDDIISVNQTYTVEQNVMHVSLEYRFDANRPVAIPTLLITNMSNSNVPNVQYIDTQYRQEASQKVATTTFTFTWNQVEDMPNYIGVRWKFNSSLDSYDFTIRK